MKKILLFTFLNFCILTAFAQETTFGLKAGGNYADINGKQLVKGSHSYKLGWHAGAMLNIQYPGNTWFSIQPELIYSRKGYESSSSDISATDNNGIVLYNYKQAGTVRLNYLDLPVMLNFKTGILVFEIGPQISYLVGLRDDIAVVQTFPDGTSLTTDISDENRIKRSQLSGLDLGFATGFRIETMNGGCLGLRFNQGLVNLRKNKNDATPAPNAFNQVFQVYAAYFFNR